VEMNFHPTAFRYFDPVEYLQGLLLNNATKVRRMQELIQSRVFELQYSLEGRHEVEVEVQVEIDEDYNPVVHAGADGGSQIGDEVLDNVIIGVPGGGGHNTPKHPTPHHGGRTHGHMRSHGGRHHHSNSSAHHTKSSTTVATTTTALSTWPRYPNGQPMRDAFDIIIDLCLGECFRPSPSCGKELPLTSLIFAGWHSGTIPDVRNGTVPECWNGYLDTKLNKCMPGDDPSLPPPKKAGGK
jgi:hypothetical protein